VDGWARGGLIINIYLFRVKRQEKKYDGFKIAGFFVDGFWFWDFCCKRPTIFYWGIMVVVNGSSGAYDSTL